MEGLLVAQTRHTTTGLLINEHEPLLLADLEALFERLAPVAAVYAHDDFSRRTVNVDAGRTAERPRSLSRGAPEDVGVRRRSPAAG